MWVGHIQWLQDNGFGFPSDPVLQPLQNIEQRDAILAYDAQRRPVAAEWPEAEFIVGNPPFLGDRVMRAGLGDQYVDALRVEPIRRASRRKAHRERWWLHGDPRRGLRTAIAPLRRFLMTSAVARHGLFVWVSSPTLPDQSCVAVARDDDYMFGVLHSRAHERWSLRTGTWLGKGNDPRYTPTSTFETFPFPWPLSTPDEALTSEQRAPGRQRRDGSGAGRGAPTVA